MPQAKVYDGASWQDFQLPDASVFDGSDWVPLTPPEPTYTNVALSGLGAVAYSPNGGPWWYDSGLMIDGNDGTETGGVGFTGAVWTVDLGSAKSIGRWRCLQSSNGNRQARQMALEYANDAWNGTFTRVDTVTDWVQETGNRVITPVSARYWRVYNVSSGPWDWALLSFEVHEVT